MISSDGDCEGALVTPDDLTEGAAVTVVIVGTGTPVDEVVSPLLYYSY